MKTKLNRRTKQLIIGSLVFISANAYARTCQLLQVTPLNFAPYNLELNNNTAAGNLTISCTPGTHISVAFNKGAKQHFTGRSEAI